MNATADTTGTRWAVLDEAHAALRTAVAGVPAGGWDTASPCTGWTVTQVLQHAAGDQRGFAMFITGEDGPTEDPFAPSGVLEGSPLELLDPALAVAHAAWATISPAAETAPTPLPQGALPPSVAVGACALDAAVHAWDIAVATGQPSPLTGDLARTLLDVARQIVEPLRQYGAYAAVVEVDPSAGAEAELLGYLGRSPAWTS